MSVRFIRLLMSLCLIVVAATAVAAPGGPGRYMIEFTDFNGAAAAVRAAGGEVVYEFPEMRVVAARLPESAVQGLQNHPRVRLMAPESLRYPMALWNDTTANGEITPYGIQMVQADKVSNGGAVPRVCVIDSGYALGHEDLPGSANVSGYNGNLAWDKDGDGHGTHVAGTIAAIGGNKKGVRGVLTTGANLYIVRVFGDNGAWAYESDLVNALQKCRDAGSKVVSMSLGGGKPIGPWEQNAFDSAYNNGVLSIAAAGNAGDTSVSYPAGYSSVVAVAAVDADEVVASFSQKNSTVEVAAPGVSVLSTYPKFEDNHLTVGTTKYLGNHIDAAGRTTGITNVLADGGLCSSAGAWTGKVVLCSRGEVSFKQKIDAVKAGGGLAAIIYNNVSGNFLGTCDDGTGTTCTLPAISLSMEDGQAAVALVDGIRQGTVYSQVTPSTTSYTNMDGTSMATPHVSGVAALVWSHNSAWTNAQIRDALGKTAKDKGDAGRDNSYGYGIVQTCAALQYLNPNATCSGGTTEPPPSDDTTAPSVSIDSPADGATVSGTITIGATASDNVGVSEVRFYAGTTLLGSDTSSPYSASWNTTTVANGSYTISATAYDAAGNSSTATVTVNVSNSTTTDTTAPVISGVASKRIHNNGNFEITWTTDEASNSQVTFTSGASGTYTDSTMVTSHRMTFGGKKGATYEYYVSSTDAAGNKATAGPFIHNNK